MFGQAEGMSALHYEMFLMPEDEGILWTQVKAEKQEYILNKIHLPQQVASEDHTEFNI